MRRKLVDRKVIGRSRAGMLSLYLMLPLGEFLSTQEAAAWADITNQTAYRWLPEWTQLGLFEREEYSGSAFKTTYQYRRLFNHITITKTGVLFELVKEG